MNRGIDKVDLHRALRFLSRHDAPSVNQFVMAAPVERKIMHAMREDPTWRIETVDLSAKDIATGSLALLDENEARLEEALALAAEHASKRIALGFGKMAYGYLDAIKMVRKSMGISGKRSAEAIKNLQFSMARHGMIDWGEVGK